MLYKTVILQVGPGLLLPLPSALITTESYINLLLSHTLVTLNPGKTQPFDYYGEGWRNM